MPSGGRAAAAPAAVLKARRIKLSWSSIFSSQYFQNELLKGAARWLGKGPGLRTAGSLFLGLNLLLAPRCWSLLHRFDERVPRGVGGFTGRHPAAEAWECAVSE